MRWKNGRKAEALSVLRGRAEDIDFGTYNGTMRGFDYVECQRCGAQINALHKPGVGMVAAIDIWNHRDYEGNPWREEDD